MCSSDLIAEEPTMQIVGSGLQNIDPTAMTRVDDLTYHFVWEVADTEGTQNFTLSTGTDVVGNRVTEAPASGAEKIGRAWCRERV